MEPVKEVKTAELPIEIAFTLRNAKDQIIFLERQLQKLPGVKGPFDSSVNAIKYINDVLTGHWIR